MRRRRSYTREREKEEAVDDHCKITDYLHRHPTDDEMKREKHENRDEEADDERRRKKNEREKKIKQNIRGQHLSI